jgi:hypothetical protein
MELSLLELNQNLKKNIQKLKIFEKLSKSLCAHNEKIIIDCELALKSLSIYKDGCITSFKQALESYKRNSEHVYELNQAIYGSLKVTHESLKNSHDLLKFDEKECWKTIKNPRNNNNNILSDFFNRNNENIKNSNERVENDIKKYLNSWITYFSNLTKDQSTLSKTKLPQTPETTFSKKVYDRTRSASNSCTLKTRTPSYSQVSTTPSKPYNSSYRTVTLKESLIF